MLILEISNIKSFTNLYIDIGAAIAGMSVQLIPVGKYLWIVISYLWHLHIQLLKIFTHLRNDNPTIF